MRSFSRIGRAFTTGSSDYHGTGKPNRLGENQTDPEALERIIAAASGTPYLSA